MRTIDVKNPEKILDTNKYLKDLVKIKTFTIKNGKISLKCAIIISKKTSYSVKKFHYYAIKDINDGFLLSFKKEQLPTFNEVYIDSIKKTKFNSGSQIIDTLVKFITKFESVKTIKLIDEAFINCLDKKFSYRLSLFSLLTIKSTFYGKYNFQLDPSNVNINKKINKVIDLCANTKVEDIIKQLQSNNEIINSLRIPKNISKIAKIHREQIKKFSYSDESNVSNSSKLNNDFDIFTIYTAIVSLIKILEDNLNKKETFKDLLIRLRKNNKCKHIATIIQLCTYLFYYLTYFSKSMSFFYYFKQLYDISINIRTRVLYINKNT